MGNQFSQIEFMKQDFSGFLSIFDQNFGMIKISKKKIYPFNYLMLVQHSITETTTKQQILKISQDIKKLKELHLPNIAEIYMHKYVENNSFNCNSNQIGRFQIYQQYFTYTLKKYVNSFTESRKMIDEKYIWYVAETLIKSYYALVQNRLQCTFRSDEIFISLAGQTILYPNIFLFKDKKKYEQSQNCCKTYRQVQKLSAPLSFKTELAKILMYMVFLQQKYEYFIDEVQNCSQIDIQKVIKVIQSCSYSSKLKKFLISLSTQYILNWKKTLQQYFQNSIQKVNALKISDASEEFKLLEICQSNKKRLNSTISYPISHSVPQTPLKMRSNLQKLRKLDLNKLKNKQSQQQTEGNLNSSSNCISSNSLQKTPKHEFQIKHKISLGSSITHRK